MENFRKIVKYRLLAIQKTIKKYVCRASFVSQKIFSRNFVAIHEIKPMFTLDKPIYVGFSILDLSRLLMHEFHNKYMGIKYGSSAKLLFTDIDSLVYEIETNDVYEDFYEEKSLFDFSDYPNDSRFYDLVSQ